MGSFVPCIPVHIVEFGENGIWFDYQRYCKPFINDDILNAIFGDLADKVRSEFIVPNNSGGYDMELKYETQRQVEEHFAAMEESEENERLKNGLYDLISNVIFFEDENSDGQEFHFRISMDKTHSFYHLIPHVQEKLKALYVNYFYRRQDEFQSAGLSYCTGCRGCADPAPRRGRCCRFPARSPCGPSTRRPTCSRRNAAPCP